MTRRDLLGLVPMGLLATKDPVNTGNEVSETGIAMDAAFLEWGNEWNRREYGTRSATEHILWERYKRAHDKFMNAHKRWERGY